MNIRILIKIKNLEQYKAIVKLALEYGVRWNSGTYEIREDYYQDGVYLGFNIYTNADNVKTIGMFYHSLEQVRKEGEDNFLVVETDYGLGTLKPLLKTFSKRKILIEGEDDGKSETRKGRRTSTSKRRGFQEPTDPNQRSS